MQRLEACHRIHQLNLFDDEWWFNLSKCWYHLSLRYPSTGLKNYMLNVSTTIPQASDTKNIGPRDKKRCSKAGNKPPEHRQGWAQVVYVAEVSFFWPRIGASLRMFLASFPWRITRFWMGSSEVHGSSPIFVETTTSKRQQVLPSSMGSGHGRESQAACLDKIRENLSLWRDFAQHPAVNLGVLWKCARHAPDILDSHPF